MGELREKSQFLLWTETGTFTIPAEVMTFVWNHDPTIVITSIRVVGTPEMLKWGMIQSGVAPEYIDSVVDCSITASVFGSDPNIAPEINDWVDSLEEKPLWIQPQASPMVPVFIKPLEPIVEAIATGNLERFRELVEAGVALSLEPGLTLGNLICDFDYTILDPNRRQAILPPKLEMLRYLNFKGSLYFDGMRSPIEVALESFQVINWMNTPDIWRQSVAILETLLQLGSPTIFRNDQTIMDLAIELLVGSISESNDVELLEQITIPFVYPEVITFLRAIGLTASKYFDFRTRKAKDDEIDFLIENYGLQYDDGYRDYDDDTDEYGPVRNIYHLKVVEILRSPIPVSTILKIRERFYFSPLTQKLLWEL